MHALATEFLNDLGVALKRFGEYSFDDKGPSEVMEINGKLKKIRALPVDEAVAVLTDLIKAKKFKGRGQRLAQCLIGNMENWDALFEHEIIAENY